MRLRLALLLMGLGLGIQFETHAQFQIGSDIVGPEAGAQLGYAIDISPDGLHMVLGTPVYDGSSTHKGLAQVFEFQDGDWVQKGGNIIGDAWEHQLGSAVAINADGTRFVVSSPRSNMNGSHSGHVEAFEWNGSSWLPMGALIPGNYQEYFGTRVEMNDAGDRIMMSSVRFEDGRGRVEVYEWENDQWVQMGTDLVGDAASNYFGGSLQMTPEGDRLVISAPGNNTLAERGGQIKVFDWNGSDWEPLDAEIYGELQYFTLGEELDISDDGNIIVASGPNAFSGSTGQWRTRCYQWNGTEWLQRGNDIVADEVGDYFGAFISMNGSGRVLAIGGYESDLYGARYGLVRVFEFHGADWEQIGVDLTGSSAWDWAGQDVALSSDGKRLAVGSRGYSSENHGRVQVFDLTLILGVDDSLIESLSISPNPVTHSLQLHNPMELSLTAIEVFDVLGQRVMAFDLTTSDYRNLDISSLVSGLYLLEVRAASGATQVFKFLKE